MAIVTKDLEEKLGKEKVEELIDKEWKVAELPSEEELAKEKSESLMARNNPNSRKNLVQYQKRKPRKAKEAAIKNLKVIEKQDDINPSEIFGSKFDFSILEDIVPVANVLKDRDEQKTFYSSIKLWLHDFNPEELSASDLDDIITLAQNTVMINRLLKACTSADKMLLEASPTIEKMKKQNQQIKSNLASRRVDRIDLKNKPAMSIVELASHLDAQNKADFEERIRILEREEKDYSPPKRTEAGLLIEED